ncbi:MAG: hypothetical protein JO257_35970 [Deltaproteobacteria bacterium]|nr:hypothetical protein [Deltaproteobacteria bacterium]
MQFCPWYPLADAGTHAPAAEGVLQVRLATGLIDYPTGKSAMVHYAYATNVRESALALAAAHGNGAGFVCRHVEEVPPDVDLAAFHAKVREEFVRRFGREPGFP